MSDRAEGFPLVGLLRQGAKQPVLYYLHHELQLTDFRSGPRISPAGHRFLHLLLLLHKIFPILFQFQLLFCFFQSQIYTLNPEDCSIRNCRTHLRSRAEVSDRAEEFERVGFLRQGVRRGAHRSVGLVHAAEDLHTESQKGKKRTEKNGKTVKVREGETIYQAQQ